MFTFARDLVAVHYSQCIDHLIFILIWLLYIIRYGLIMFRCSCLGWCILFTMGRIYSPCSCFDRCTVLTMVDQVPLAYALTDVLYLHWSDHVHLACALAAVQYSQWLMSHLLVL